MCPDIRLSFKEFPVPWLTTFTPITKEKLMTKTRKTAKSRRKITSATIRTSWLRGKERGILKEAAKKMWWWRLPQRFRHRRMLLWLQPNFHRGSEVRPSILRLHFREWNPTIPFPRRAITMPASTRWPGSTACWWKTAEEWHKLRCSRPTMTTFKATKWPCKGHHKLLKSEWWSTSFEREDFSCKWNRCDKQLLWLKLQITERDLCLDIWLRETPTWFRDPHRQLTPLAESTFTATHREHCQAIRGETNLQSTTLAAISLDPVNVLPAHQAATLLQKSADQNHSSLRWPQVHCQIRMLTPTVMTAWISPTTYLSMTTAASLGPAEVLSFNMQLPAQMFLRHRRTQIILTCLLTKFLLITTVIIKMNISTTFRRALNLRMSLLLLPRQALPTHFRDRWLSGSTTINANNKLLLRFQEWALPLSPFTPNLSKLHDTICNNLISLNRPNLLLQDQERILSIQQRSKLKTQTPKYSLTQKMFTCW